jgi:hypothetical protein
MRKTIRYAIPDKLYSTEKTLRKASSVEYDGPDELILYIDKDTGRLEENYHPDEEPDRPLALNHERVILDGTESDENLIKIALLWGGIPAPTRYEVAIGPDDQPNILLTDPTDLVMVYDEYGLYEDYTRPLEFLEFKKERSDEFYRSERNSRLSASDSKLAIDMPESLKQEWMEYRQKLRDWPSDWEGVPNYIRRFPLSPEETSDPEFDDPNVEYVSIADRGTEWAAIQKQLPDTVR